MKKHKVAIYIRVSTKKQVEEGYSLEAQKERLVKLCETNGYIVYKVYADEGKSGKDTNRPAFQEMMKDMKDKKFNVILAFKLIPVIVPSVPSTGANTITIASPPEK